MRIFVRPRENFLDLFSPFGSQLGRGAHDADWTFVQHDRAQADERAQLVRNFLFAKEAAAVTRSKRDDGFILTDKFEPIGA
jgi:hypothetical protein